MLRRFRGPIWLIKGTISWLFGAPFRDLPPAFGDTVPPDLRAYEHEVEQMAHHPVGTVSKTKSHGHQQSKPTH